MKFVRSLTEGTVVTAHHVIHADRATPFQSVPEELLALSRRTPPKVAITDADPFVMQAEGIVVPRTKNGVRAGGPTAEELAAAEAEEQKRLAAEEEERKRQEAEEAAAREREEAEQKAAEEQKRQEAEEAEARQRAAEEEEAERRQQEAETAKTAGSGKAGSKSGAKAGGKSGK